MKKTPPNSKGRTSGLYKGRFSPKICQVMMIPLNLQLPQGIFRLLKPSLEFMPGNSAGDLFGMVSSLDLLERLVR